MRTKGTLSIKWWPGSEAIIIVMGGGGGGGAGRNDPKIYLHVKLC